MLTRPLRHSPSRRPRCPKQISATCRACWRRGGLRRVEAAGEAAGRAYRPALERGCRPIARPARAAHHAADKRQNGGATPAEQRQNHTGPAQSEESGQSEVSEHGVRSLATPTAPVRLCSDGQRLPVLSRLRVLETAGLQGRCVTGRPQQPVSYQQLVLPAEHAGCESVGTGLEQCVLRRTRGSYKLGCSWTKHGPTYLQRMQYTIHKPIRVSYDIGTRRLEIASARSPADPFGSR